METLNINNSKIELDNVSSIKYRTESIKKTKGDIDYYEAGNSKWDGVTLILKTQISENLVKQLQTEEKLYLTTKNGNVEIVVDNISIDNLTINIKPKYCTLID